MGSRTHVGITGKHGNVQFVYGHWEAPLFRAGADILMGELDSEAYIWKVSCHYQSLGPT